MPQLNQKSWVDLFSSINGRPPTSFEYKEALKKGEFQLDRKSSSELKDLSKDQTMEGELDHLEGAPAYETNQTISRDVSEFEQGHSGIDFVGNKIEQQFDQTRKEETQIYYSNPFSDNNKANQGFHPNDFNEDSGSAVRQFIKLLVVIGLLVGAVYSCYLFQPFSYFSLSRESQVNNLNGVYTGEYEKINLKVTIEESQLVVEANNGILEGTFEGEIDTQTKTVEFILWGNLRVQGSYRLDDGDIVIKVIDSKNDIRLSKEE